ncbi:secreted ookinete protein, putative (PSOP20) [Plasmodium ovale wallikeri]|uniref:Secreted ookinete protein, putative (PSOP20) n=1 Tax=Plasmodium ovale wallikeri TaxID=864142 RepID=A0A1A8ZVH9_PLAOA|nr:secreted ookinete protein, putative (PSOP20) [Plasmodium ovale wallikeri]SBT48394.1 secreted ookinete protein, putative (PSOP20) [Plasmodium ovale wallikeri]
MYKRSLLMLYCALLGILCAESKTVVSYLLSFLNSKISPKKEISKVIQMGNTMACLVDQENSFYNECSCTFKRVTDFEKKCSSHFKKSQEEAKNCSEEHCETCCNLASSKNTTNSILDYELLCKKKCTKSTIISNGNEEDYKLAFKKLIEFIRIFFPPNVLHYYPIQKKHFPNYTNRLLDSSTEKEHSIFNDNRKIIKTAKKKKKKIVCFNRFTLCTHLFLF